MMTTDKPIVWFDIESTGVDRENDRIVELCMVKINADGPREVKTRRFNPEMPIPAGASEVHGIYDDDVKYEPAFRQVAKGIHAFIQGCDLGGFNSNAFDIPMLYHEFLRAGIEWDYSQCRMIDVGNIYKRLYPRTLESSVKNFLGREHDGAHGAEADTLATIEVFDYFMGLGSEELPADMDGISLYSNYDKKMLDVSGKFSLADDGETIILNFGKYRGQPATDNIDFIEWMIYKANFSPDVNRICEQILKEHYGE